MNTKRHRRHPIDPWSGHNLRLIRAACDVTLLKQGLSPRMSFNGPTNRLAKKSKSC